MTELAASSSEPAGPARRWWYVVAARVGWTSIAMGVGTLLVASIVFYALQETAQNADRALFQRVTDQLAGDVARRLQTTAQALQTTGVAAGAAEGAMTQGLWSDYVASTGLTEQSGLVGMGYIRRVARAQLAEHEAWVRARGVPRYAAGRSGDHDPLYLVTFLVPADANAAALGIDIADGNNRRAAAEEAMREHRVVMSRRIRVIVGESSTPGFLLFFPVYVAGEPVGTVAERQAAGLGWVYASVRVDTLLRPLEAPGADQIDFRVFEEDPAGGASRLLWQSSPDPAAPASAASESPRFTRQLTLDVFGQPWRIEVRSRRTLQVATAHQVAWLAFALSLALGAVMVGITARLSGSRTRAVAQAAQAEASLALANEQTERLTNVARNIHNAVLITNPQHGVEWCNEGFTRLTGWKLEEVKGRHPGQLLQGADTDPAVVRHMGQQLRAGKPFSAEVLNYHKNGKPYWVLIDAQPQHDPHGRLTGYLAVETDITERKQTALRLAQQEAQLRFVFESSPVGLSWMLDNRSDTRRVNPAHVRISGVPADRSHDDAAYLATIHPEDAPKLRELDALIDAGKIDRYEIERRFVHPDGRVVWAEYSRRHFVDPLTGHRQDVATMIDITALKEQAADLITAKEAAEDANRSKSQFLAMMSHEIRTPMNGVIGTASLLLETKLTPQQQDFARTIARSGGDLLTIINDILDFSKIESGHLKVESEEFDLLECLAESIDLLALRAAEKNLELLLDVTSDLPARATGDPIRLRQVLVNLLSNAVKFTERGEVRLKVSAQAVARARTELRFEVIDTGIGISPRKIPRLFDAFTQLDASTTRRYGGTGLGLPICKRLVTLMGGSMWWDSELGRGTLFGFALKTPTPAASSGERWAGGPSDLTARRILIVDGNASSRRILTTWAEAWDLQVTAHASVAAARAARATGDDAGAVAAVLLDRAETGGVGVPEVARLRAAVGGPPVILLAPRTYPLGLDDRRHFATVQAKPIDPRELARNLTAVLTGAQPADGEEPRAVEAAPPPAAQASPAPVQPAGPAPVRVLVVDDNAVNQELVTLMLNSLGYPNSTVDDGVKVLPRIQQDYFDVLLMDVQMPGMDGFEATQLVRATLGDARHPWIVAVTANAMAGDREKCLKAGMNDYLSKPLKIQDLAETMRRAVKALAEG